MMISSPEQVISSIQRFNERDIVGEDKMIGYRIEVVSVEY